MELVSICLFFIFSALIAFNYHKAVLILGPLFVLCQPYMCLRYNSPAISLLFITQFVVLFCAYIRKRIRLKSFPLRKAFYVMFSTLAVGLFASPHSVASLLPWLLSYVVSYLFIVVYYTELNSLSDVKLSLKSFLCASIFLFAYFIFEFTTQSNPFIQSMFDLLGMDNGWVYPITERFGMIRCQSFMSICIAWGGFCSIVLGAVLLVRKYAVLDRMNIVLILMAIIAVCGVYLCGSRSAYIFLFVIMCNFFFEYKGGKRILMIFALMIGVLAFLPSIMTFIGETFSDDVAGSSVSMRQMQYIATFSVMMESPIWGFGIKGFEFAIAEDADLLGAESIWLQRMISYGLIGVFMQFYMYKSCWRFIKVFGNNSVLCKFILLGWVLFCTMTTSPGLSESYFISILILLCKTITFVSETSNTLIAKS